MNRTTRRRSQRQQPRSQAPGRRCFFSRDESGGVAVTTAICLVFLIGFVALVLDVGHLQAVRNEVQNAADAAALAGCRALFPYQGYPGSNIIPITEPPFCSLAVTTAKAAASENHPGAIVDMAFAPDDVETGIWDKTNRTFTPQASCTMDINAVRVTIRKDSVANQPVATWFASIIGIDSVNVNAQAVAWVGFLKSIVNDEDNGVLAPIAISDVYNDNLVVYDDAGTFILNPDKSDNGGWCGPIDQTVNAFNLKDWISSAGTPNPPPTSENPDNPNGEWMAGVQVNLNNGLMGSVHNELQQAIDAHWQTRINGVEGLDGWLVMVPVVSVDKYNQSTTVVELQPIVLTGVAKPNNNITHDWGILFKKIPDGVDLAIIGGTSGGEVSNLYATLPKLVQ